MSWCQIHLPKGPSSSQDSLNFNLVYCVASWMAFVLRDLARFIIKNDCECQHQSQFSPFKKIGVLYCFGISLVHNFIYHSIGIKFIERSSMQAYFSSPNILHSVIRDLKYPDPLLSLGATHCLSRKFISKTLKVQKRWGMSNRWYPYSLVLKLYFPQMHTYNIQHVSIQCSLPKNGRAGSTVLQKLHSWTVCIIIH